MRIDIYFYDKLYATQILKGTKKTQSPIFCSVQNQKKNNKSKKRPGSPVLCIHIHIHISSKYLACNGIWGHNMLKVLKSVPGKFAMTAHCLVGGRRLLIKACIVKRIWGKRKQTRKGHKAVSGDADHGLCKPPSSTNEHGCFKIKTAEGDTSLNSTYWVHHRFSLPWGIQKLILTQAMCLVFFFFDMESFIWWPETLPVKKY